MFRAVGRLDSTADFSRKSKWDLVVIIYLNNQIATKDCLRESFPQWYKSCKVAFSQLAVIYIAVCMVVTWLELA